MELVAATMASCMDVLWRKELHMHLTDSVFWTDSASVLKYIRNETSRFKVFVANRVSERLHNPLNGDMLKLQATQLMLPPGV